MNPGFYVTPEQLVRDRAEFARKGIARGRSIVAMEFRKGILMLAENPGGPSTRSARCTTGSPSRGWAVTTNSRRFAKQGYARPT